MELEVKHLAPYLPYGLQLQYVVRGIVEKVGTMVTINHNENETHPTKIRISMGDGEHIWMFKPILKPLSKLTKRELQDNCNSDGINFVVDILINKENTKAAALLKLVSSKEPSVEDIPLGIANYLFKNHYDVFGLIEQDLAVEKEEI